MANENDKERGHILLNLIAIWIAWWLLSSYMEARQINEIEPNLVHKVTMLDAMFVHHTVNR